MLILGLPHSGGATGIAERLRSNCLPMAACMAHLMWLMPYLLRRRFPAAYTWAYRNLSELGLLSAIVFDEKPFTRVYRGDSYKGRWLDNAIAGFQPGRDSLRGRIDALLLNYDSACRDMNLAPLPRAYVIQGYISLALWILLFLLFQLLSTAGHNNDAWAENLFQFLSAWPLSPWILALLLAPGIAWATGTHSAERWAQALAVADALDALAAEHGPPPGPQGAASWG